MTNVYLLSERAKCVTWKKWKAMGGCGLSDCSYSAVARHLGILELSNPTLGQVQAACVVAGREIARFGKDHLHKKDWAVVEYENI